ncbi:MAG TPA: DUF2784 domain-containing protein [Lysobacter sp.]|nr:DUF2784 domain-containing protein [Lysobacter sp.]
MTGIASGTAALLADAILALHVGVVVFVVFGEVLFLVGGVRGWRWVRGFRLRVVHLALMGFIALQAWLGALCPLTVWEQQLRTRAGQTAYRESFIEHWLSRVLYYDLPWWTFVAAYTAFAVLVAITWRFVPPQRRPRSRSA